MYEQILLNHSKEIDMYSLKQLVGAKAPENGKLN